jgi:hypothetical protein
MSNTVGIENIKNCVGFVLDITEDFQKSLADGKFTLKDSFLFVDNIPQVPKVIRAAAKFWEEFQDMDETEEAEIAQFVSDRIQCDNFKAKAIVVQSLKLAITIGQVATEGIELSKIIKAA